MHWFGGNLRPTKARREPRRGAVLILFALLVFAFFAIASAAIDFGSVSLAQASMETATDTAALEGLRLRDYRSSQADSDLRRRGRAAELLRQQFDDDLRPTAGGITDDFGTVLAPDDADALRLGAGPMLALEGGVGAANVKATIVVPEVPVWDDPQPQVNLANARHGDLVAGRFDIDAEVHVESSDYARTDFAAGDDADPALTTRKSLSFLARMRRTNDLADLDDVPGVSSHGPTIALLFGLGSLIRQAHGSTWNPRRDGVTVRSSAIASARPALRVGRPPRTSTGALIPDESGLDAVSPGPCFEPNTFKSMGVYRLALTNTYWQSLAFVPATSGVLVIDSTGALRDSTNLDTVVGRLCAEALVVGERIVPVSGAEPLNNVKRGFLPIYTRIAEPDGTTRERVIGFGFGVFRRYPNDLGLRVTKGFTCWPDSRIWVAANNASAHLGDDVPDLTPEQWEQVFAANRHFAYGDAAPSYDWRHVQPGTLLAPVLTR